MRTLTKKPLQVYLEFDQDQALRALAQRMQVSLAELIRRSVGLGSGPSDLARNHDQYLIEFERQCNHPWPEKSL